MQKLTVSFVLIFLATSVYSQECFDYIKQLAERDKCLSSRIFTKYAFAKVNNESEYFSKVVQSTCNGTEFACGKTLSWVTEVFEGLSSSSQYNEHKYSGFAEGSNAGFYNLNGFVLKILLNAYRFLPYTIVYHLRFTGTEDHVWTIEQLPNQGGYRIYQSYHDAYSLKAWLSTSLNGLYAETTGDIMNIVNVKVQTDSFIQSLTGGQLNMNTILSVPSSSVPAEFQTYLPYISYIKNYNETTAINNLKKAWETYGKGKVISWNEFNGYLNKLAGIVDYLKINEKSTTPFSQNIWDDWVSLFGSPNPVHFPNLAYNGIIKYLIPNEIFRFEMKPVIFDRCQPNCQTNAYLIR